MSQGDSEEFSIDIRRGTPDAEELAAVIAVVREAYAEETAEAVAPETTARSRWELSARGLRAPLRRENGWSGFAG